MEWNKMELNEQGKHGEELEEFVNQNPQAWYNSMVSWYKAHKYMDRAGDMISGSFEDIGGWR